MKKLERQQTKGVYDLSRMNIWDQDVIPIAKKLKKQKVVKKLKLCDNDISDKGVAWLLDEMAELHVESLDVSGNKLTFQSMASLLEYVSSNKFVKRITFKNISVKSNLKWSYATSFKNKNVLFEY